MIFGIGTDIVSVQRMRRNLERYGERFARRILTDRELEEFRAAARPENFLAKRFAAKEAAAKAMGTGFSGGLSLRHIGVAHDASGKPLLMLSGYAEQFVRHHRITETHLSIADEKEQAVAFVTLVDGVH
ncbi:MAG: holo-ACP synthase [Pseudomonadota bacterium]|nr:MAG: holo-ACP synthase [Pseudomonadota bacterium]